MARTPRQSRPNTESLEPRTLLSGTTQPHLPGGQPISEQDKIALLDKLQTWGFKSPNVTYGQISKTLRAQDLGPRSRRLVLPVPDGGLVILTLYGKGSLAGTRFTNGALNILYNQTDQESRLIGKVIGRTDPVPLRVVVDREILATEGGLIGIGGNKLGVINLSQFDLIDGGVIFQAGGVNPILHLNRVGANTLIDVIADPPPPEQDTAPVTSIDVTATFVTGGLFTGVGGLEVPGAIAVQLLPEDAEDPIVGSGAKLIFHEVEGGSGELGDAVMFAYDDTTERLIEFDIKRVVRRSGTTDTNVLVGFPDRSIDLSAVIPPGFDGNAGVGMGRVQGIGEVVLVGIGEEVYAYNAVTLASTSSVPGLQGSFTVSSLSADYLAGQYVNTDFYFNQVDGLGTSDFNTFLVDSTGGPDQQGRSILIDLTESLQTGDARLLRRPLPTVPAPVPSTADDPAGSFSDVFTPRRDFFLAAGASGVAGREFAYMNGGAYFDTFTPTTLLNGYMKADTVPSFREEERIQRGSAPFDLQDRQPEAMGSLDQRLAVPGGEGTLNIVQPDGSVAPNVPVLNLNMVSPDTLGGAGTVYLNLPAGSAVTGLSESFYPAVDASTVINVLGVTHLLQANRVDGLVFNNIGYTNLISLDSVSNSSFVGLPIGHLDIGVQGPNVTYLSTTDRGTSVGGVTRIDGLREIGPLLPTTPLLAGAVQPVQAVARLAPRRVPQRF